MSPQKTVLILEDEPSLLQAVKYKLEQADYTVLSAHDGIEGRQVLDSQTVDMVLLDLLMPRSDGCDFLNRMSQEERERIPVIILTNFPTDQKSATVEDIIIKSDVSLDSVVSRVEQYFAEQKET
ncbi:response regulator [Candidatus Woesebacteria bacterium]|nr:response regulator [Candidatus Woesebacteria bacterium]MCD8507495.1 response regulator [Candidatus Woesebacteria bacterium]MCD8526950.1 response regulator [Candidatus Woesebacteria bacterium]MCD8545849.1 response regulator [Candidatus Woesebacteria bacterium]